MPFDEKTVSPVQVSDIDVIHADWIWPNENNGIFVFAGSLLAGQAPLGTPQPSGCRRMVPLVLLLTAQLPNVAVQVDPETSPELARALLDSCSIVLGEGRERATPVHPATSDATSDVTSGASLDAGPGIDPGADSPRESDTHGAPDGQAPGAEVCFAARAVSAIPSSEGAPPQPSHLATVRQLPDGEGVRVEVTVHHTSGTARRARREIRFPSAPLDREAWVSVGLIVAATVNATELDPEAEPPRALPQPTAAPSDVPRRPMPQVLTPRRQLETLELELAALARTTSDLTSFAPGGMLRGTLLVSGPLVPALAVRVSGSDDPASHQTVSGALGAEWRPSRAEPWGVRADARVDFSRWRATEPGREDSARTVQAGGGLALVAMGALGDGAGWVASAGVTALLPTVAVRVAGEPRSQGFLLGSELTLGLKTGF